MSDTAVGVEVRQRRWALRAGLAGLGAVVATLAFAVPASAHVKVSGTDAVQAGSGVLTFRVPTESATASTTALLITFPANTPFTSVDTQPKAGWTATVEKKPLADPVPGEDGSTITQYVSQVDFAATGPASAIPPGQFDMFNLSVGPFPKASSVSFGALQTYSDGTTVNWDEQSGDGTTEPAHPAPVLQLSPGGSGTSAAGAQSMAGMSGTTGMTGQGSSSGSSWTGIAGLVLGIVALVIGAAALVLALTRRRTTAGS
ncbi:MAG TPA: YcnI family protein [Pseudonocardia sp.]